MTGGTIPLGITSASEEIYNAFYSDEKSKMFLHGHSFSANPVGCAASLASLDLLERNDCLSKIKMLENFHKCFLEEIKKYSFVKNRRVIGTIFAFDIDTCGENSYFHSLRDKI